MILAIDQGTTGTTCLVFDLEGRIAGRAYSEFAPALPAPGLGRARRQRDLGGDPGGRRRRDRRRGVEGSALTGIGITNQRETVVAWDPASGEPVHNALVWQDRRTAERCDRLRRPRARAAGARADRPGHRPLLLRDQDRVAAGQRRGCPRGGLRHDRLLARLQAHRAPPHRLLERVADDALRHPQAGLGPGPLRAARGRPLPAAGARSLLRRPRDHLGVRRRGPGRRDRRRPAGGALRPGLPRARGSQEHLRDRQLRPAQHRRRGVPARRGAADHGRLGPRRGGRVRARGRDLRHRRRGAVAPRRARDPLGGLRDRRRWPHRWRGTTASTSSPP